jgi:hypothetical protein
MRKIVCGLFIMILIVIGGCAGQSESNSASNDSATSSSSGGSSSSADSTGSTERFDQKMEKSENRQASQTAAEQNRMIAYEAYLTVRTKAVDELIEKVRSEVNTAGGYLVESSIQRIDGEKKNAHLLLRIPSEAFNSLLSFVEENSDELVERNVRGQDVTEEYVDLESRLKAKKVYEERLLSFLENAEKTEDLLKISEDLSVIQSEIEQVEGRMNYLRNRTDYASVNLTIRDSSITVPNISDNQQLNTVDRTKEAFVVSLNKIASFLSTLIVLFVGYLPIWLGLLLCGSAAWFVTRKMKQKRAE